ncbi:uncharacterized protein LOC130991624 isoform X2 [Salvia miltiorrhiza]|nr:uncharacterized protein LOC130991624 isoform X2 [Salvia miltiorrhiza]
MRRYQDSNLKIESLRLKIQGCRRSFEPLAHKLIVDAMKLGATDLKIEFFTFVLPPEVLRSESLLRLSVSGCEIDGNVNCSMLKSLSLDSVLLKSDDMLRIITSCCNSIEELSLSNSFFSNQRILLSGTNLHELHKLKRLYLEMVDVDKSFFDDLESRFPCLEDMSLVNCHGYRQIWVASSSLQRINIEQPVNVLIGKFKVPILAVFSYSGVGIPSLSIDARDEWESHISIERHHFRISSSWYRDLHKRLTQLSLSRINLTIKIVGSRPCTKRIAGVYNVHVVGEPVAVENMKLEAKYDAGCILRCLFCICRPKLVTHCWLDRECGKKSDDHSLESLCEKLMGPKRDRNMFERFDLKEGQMEVYEEDEAEWRPLLLQDAIRAPPMGRKLRSTLSCVLKWKSANESKPNCRKL